jgi:hypothetical protein
MIIFSSSGIPSGRGVRYAGVYEYAFYARIFVYKFICKKGIDSTFFSASRSNG